MKIRNGFVSNSSSSSYVLIAMDKDYEELMQKAHPLARAISNELKWTSKKIGNNDVKVLEWWEGNNSSLEWIDIDKNLVEQYKEDAKRNENYEYDYDFHAISESWQGFIKLAEKYGLLLRNDDS